MLAGESKALFNSRGRRIIGGVRSALWSWAAHSLFDRTPQSQMVIRGRCGGGGGCDTFPEVQGPWARKKADPLLQRFSAHTLLPEKWASSSLAELVNLDPSFNILACGGLPCSAAHLPGYLPAAPDHCGVKPSAPPPPLWGAQPLPVAHMPNAASPLPP